MDVLTTVMLFGAGIFGGALAGLVGGASLITFPALLGAGLPPVTATVTNLAAISPANFMAAWSDRSQMPPVDRGFAGILLGCCLAALAGAALLLSTPNKVLQVLIPPLLAFATLMVALSPQLLARLRERAERLGRPAPRLSLTSMPMLLPVSMYGGYFGAGVGVLLLAVLSMATGGDYRSANVIKNLVTGTSTVVIVIFFALNGAVAWPAAIVMAAGALIGGGLGGVLARVVPPFAMRIIVVAIGAMLTAVYTWRYWF